MMARLFGRKDWNEAQVATLILATLLPRIAKTRSP